MKKIMIAALFIMTCYGLFGAVEPSSYACGCGDELANVEPEPMILGMKKHHFVYKLQVLASIILAAVFIAGFFILLWKRSRHKRV